MTRMRNYRNQPSGTVDRARALRRAASPAEKKMLRALRENFPTAKFRHQTPVGPFYADFFSFKAQLVIEIDGDSHGTTQAQDAARTQFMNNEGYRVIRFWNNEIADNLEGVIGAVSDILSPSPSHA